MALLKGTNSYATVAEADTYFEDRLDVAAWTDASATAKAQALVTATAALDEQNWFGYAVSETQDLAFPRVGSYFDPRLGLDVTLTEEVPTRVVTACYELAYHMLNNDGILDDIGALSSLQVGSINLVIRAQANKLPFTVKKIIGPLLINAGTNLWWRAN